jgi:hypothetical protein
LAKGNVLTGFVPLKLGEGRKWLDNVLISVHDFSREGEIPRF